MLGKCPLCRARGTSQQGRGRGCDYRGRGSGKAEMDKVQEVEGEINSSSDQEEKEGQIINIQGKEEEVEAEELRRQQRRLPEPSKTLMAQLLPILYSAEDIIESFLLKTTYRRQMGVFNKITKTPLLAFSPWSQVQLSCKMKEIEKSVRAVLIKFGKVDKTVDLVPQPLGLHRRHSNSAQHCYIETPDLLIGRGDTEKDMVGRLINDDEENLRVISLVSKESLGKTALAKKIPVGVVKNIELMSEGQLSVMLFQIFMDLKFLIVLDNLPTVDVWRKLVRPFADTRNGSRVIITTRNTDVASQVDPWSLPVGLERLTEEDSWLLFLNKVGTPEHNNGMNRFSDHLSSFRVEILRICHGSPPVIVLLGGMLSTMELSKWSNVIDHLSHLCGKDDHSVLLSSILALSYRKLPFVLRPCFLYLALFPKMYEIPIRRLLHLWLAEGFVETLTKVTSVVPEDVAQSYLEELVCRNMIQIARKKLDGSPKTCRLPCFLHDVFLSKAEDIGFLHVHHGQSDCTPKSNFVVRRLADQYFGVKSTSEYHTQKLCSYLSFETQKRNTSNREIETLLKLIMRKRSSAFLLKVFDLENIYRPVLPDKLGELQNLTYIGLRWSGLNSCPASIGDLPHLETLDLKYTNITTLPVQFGRQEPSTSYMNEVSIPKPSKEPSAHLQTLVGLQIGSKDPDEYGLNRLTSLRKLRLTCHSKSVKKILNCISGLGNLQTLKLRSRDPFGQPLDIFLGNELKVHQSLSSLSLFGVLKDDIGKLPQLNILGLLLALIQARKWNIVQGTFRNACLKIVDARKSRGVVGGKGGLPKLEEMEIRGWEN
ncbi:hypothetical protein C3L33_17468, partial [Rhododendron williamsianum]